ncbi:hypothetical protein N7468_010103 [Penicillium chermesinum]|uniref:F-box domain-containing protein n=1 Tax=Penicillium chermesinum TaxID=63820 RepID=A0A9W9NC08_9EURO|nr:uncharacterized protein N7468_010103 [Penicillium chermesinum]KAJ5217095.1 hypothetical protein N7468_010103 [Penicillium chermesinum]
MNFMKLPAELRLKIYGELATGPLGGPCYSAIYILRTCKKVYQEAREVIYSKNLFLFVDADDFVIIFLQAIGIQNASLIKHVHISFPIFDQTGDDYIFDRNEAVVCDVIAQRCPRIEHVTIIPTHPLFFQYTPDDDVNASTDRFLELVNKRFREFTDRISISLFEDACHDIRGKLSSLGWDVIVERKKEYYPRQSAPQGDRELTDTDNNFGDSGFGV